MNDLHATVKEIQARQRDLETTRKNLAAVVGDQEHEPAARLQYDAACAAVVRLKRPRPRVCPEDASAKENHMTKAPKKQMFITETLPSPTEAKFALRAAREAIADKQGLVTTFENDHKSAKKEIEASEADLDAADLDLLAAAQGSDEEKKADKAQAKA
jgi:hypothetical protein